MAADRSSRRRAALGVAMFVAAVAALLALGQMVDVAAHVSSARDWLRGFGVAAPVVYAALYVVLTLVGVPGTPLTVLAALFFGPIVGLAVMVAATTVAAIAGFMIARYLARDRLERLLGGYGRYEALQELIAAEPVIAVPFARLMPVFPFALVNYAFGLSRMPMWKYLLASELAMIPMNVVFVFSASAVYRTVIRGDVPWGILLGSLGAAVVLVVICFTVRRAFGVPRGLTTEAAP